MAEASRGSLDASAGTPCPRARGSRVLAPAVCGVGQGTRHRAGRAGALGSADPAAPLAADLDLLPQEPSAGLGLVLRRLGVVHEPDLVPLRIVVVDDVDH